MTEGLAAMLASFSKEPRRGAYAHLWHSETLQIRVARRHLQLVGEGYHRWVAYRKFEGRAFARGRTIKELIAAIVTARLEKAP